MDVSIRVVTAVRAVPMERSRLLPVDWLRGLVMVLMTVDHSSSAFNAGRLFGDSAQGWVPGTALPAAQFFTRWITHLCAPTFLFLSGYSLFISVQRRKRDGASEADITRFIATRGLLIAALDPLWMVFVHRGELVLQVLYAIGVSMVAMAFLRRLPAGVCGALGLLLIVLHEAIANAPRARRRARDGRCWCSPLVPGRRRGLPGPLPVRSLAGGDAPRLGGGRHRPGGSPESFQTRLLLASGRRAPGVRGGPRPERVRQRGALSRGQHAHPVAPHREVPGEPELPRLRARHRLAVCSRRCGPPRSPGGSERR